MIKIKLLLFNKCNVFIINVYSKLSLVKLKDQSTTTTSQVLALPKQIVDDTISTRSSYGTYTNNK